MKNNKYAPYILGPILLLIWGLIFYKIYQAVYGNGEDFEAPNYGALPVFETVQKDSSYALLMDYRDPFLGKSFQYNSRPQTAAASRSASPSRATNTKRRAATPAPTTTSASSFPKVIYQGYQVLEQDTIALLKINGRFYPTARKGAVLQGVQIQGIYKDSVQVVFKEQEQAFFKRGNLQ